jgi:type IV pilus biogenesis protein CpaD/CtpE
VPVAVAVLAAVLALLLAGCESDEDSTTEGRTTEVRLRKSAEEARAVALVAPGRQRMGTAVLEELLLGL